MSIVFFDMDRTLTRDISAVHLGEMIGKSEDVLALEKLIADQKITDKQFTEMLGEVAHGINYRTLVNAYLAMRIIPGIPEIIGELNGLGYQKGIITQGVGEFSLLMTLEFGFDFYHGCSTIRKSDIVEGFGAPFITADDKAKFALQKCEEFGVDPMKCYAVGDSFSDVYMFQAVGTSIAINHVQGLEEHATHSIPKCENLTEIMKYIK